MSENPNPPESRRLACDECGAHNTEDLSPGDTCPLCARGRLFPVEPRMRRTVDPCGAETSD